MLARISSGTWPEYEAKICSRGPMLRSCTPQTGPGAAATMIVRRASSGGKCRYREGDGFRKKAPEERT
ncbi:hypothetical protein RGUI_4188 (plasmid) [Rhodovulum sp. P5]|nr:hypothetical protein RGUI_4188 [Rhodovulum sp. P5]